MSETDHTIVIVKRHGNHEEEHHGGAWKIAFADFMTAMMAFFLVLWIVNSTNKETKTVIARYFNPLKLEDMSRSRRGIREEKQADSQSDNAEGGSEKSGGAPMADKSPVPAKEAAPGKETSSGVVSAPKPAADSEAVLMADPAAALNEIVSRAEAQRDEAAPARDDFQNPFKAVVAPREASPAKPQGAAEQAETPAPQPAVPSASASEQANQAARRMAEDIAKLAREISGGQAMPGVQVQATDEGMLISLTDEANFSMFPVGSAEPDARVVKLVGKIGEKLKAQQGTLVLRGHTDARPFRSKHYDNWRLSSARAQMIFYMLMRGGLAEGRIERVEGYGARKPRNPKDPLATENRRIEILLRPEKS